MRVFELARHPPQWLRVLIASLLVAFSLGSIAHTTHRHDDAPASVVHSVGCGFCIAFHGLADAPRHSGFAPAPPQRVMTNVAVASRIVSYAPQTSARPRAPPLLLK